ncbi:MAG TPA: glycosyltransferase family 4 protein [Candidatus Krumholzibacteria bacterium]|nr:glycosyltransferase family 4 protein [Candidatus Krumholzibacteria bacterium]
MKVCIVSLNIVPLFAGERGGYFGGAEVQAVFVAEVLEACGQHVSLVVADLSEPELIPFATQNAYHSAAGVRGLRFFHPRWTGVMRALERADADVYYQRNAGMITGLVAMFCKRNGKLFVYGAGSDVDFSPRDVAIRGARDRLIYNWGLKASRGFVVQNQAQRAAAARFHKPTRVIPNGVTPIDVASDDTDGTIVWIGAMWRVKRPGLLLELARRMPDRRFVVIGSGGELAKSIEREAARLPNVEMRGRLGRDEVSKVLRKAALLVNTSSVEGFPNAFLEAWNHGVPVVAFNDVDGIIAEAGVGAVCSNLDEMVRAISDLTGDRGHAAAVRARARRLVSERFSPAVLGPRYVEFFQELLSGSEPAAVEGAVAVRRS